MSTMTRRALLASLPAITLAPAAAIASTAPAETPEAELERAVAALMAAMTRVHGDGCMINRNADSSMMVVMAPWRSEKTDG